MRYLFQRLVAPNDRNGNPRRLYLVTDLETRHTTAYDEGYAGIDCVPEWVEMGPIYYLPSVRVSAKEHARLLREHGA
jgi:hypothetical protein